MAVGDAYRYSSEQYPYSVVPQVRSPEPQGSAPVLKCPPDPSIQSIVFDGQALTIIKGWQWKTKLELDEFFFPCDNFNEFEFLLMPTPVADEYHYEYHDDEIYVTLDYGLMADDSGNVPFVCIFPMWHQTTLDDQTQWFINYRFQGETEWKHLSKILMLAGSATKGVLPIEMQNNSGVDLYLKILIAK